MNDHTESAAHELAESLIANKMTGEELRTQLSTPTSESVTMSLDRYEAMKNELAELRAESAARKVWKGDSLQSLVDRAGLAKKAKNDRGTSDVMYFGGSRFEFVRNDDGTGEWTLASEFEQRA